MALIVEDGTGVSGANAYISRADFLTYHADRNNTGAVVLTPAVIDAAILYATEYLDSKYQWRANLSGGSVAESRRGSLPRQALGSGRRDTRGREMTGPDAWSVRGDCSFRTAAK